MKVSSRVRSGWDGSNRVGSGEEGLEWVGSSRVGSGRVVYKTGSFFKFRKNGRDDLDRVGSDLILRGKGKYVVDFR